MNDSILSIRDLTGHFVAPDGTVNEVLRGVSYDVARGQMTAVVGETGSGKTLTALTLLGITHPSFVRTGGTAMFEGKDLYALDEKEMRSVRGGRIAFVFQDAKAALNPVISIGAQLRDTVRLHRPGISKKAAEQAVLEAIDSVYIPEPARRMKQYAHQISGGMAQRVMIAMALLCEPELLVLDEPTTGLDVTIQADIMELIGDIQQQRGLSVCLITHDLGVVAETCDSVVVMQAGEVVEIGSVAQVITDPQNTYTSRLLTASKLTKETVAA